jgi:hypothetical protein
MLKEFFKQESVNTTITDDTSIMSSASSVNNDDKEVSPAQETPHETDSEPPQRTKENTRKTKHSRQKSLSKSLSKRQGDLFDKIGLIVLEIIKLKHWGAFKQSQKWSKLIIYLWHKDRTVTDEDFFLMRVLGRGGFGLVTGKFPHMLLEFEVLFCHRD